MHIPFLLHAVKALHKSESSERVCGMRPARSRTIWTMRAGIQFTLKVAHLVPGRQIAGHPVLITIAYIPPALLREFGL